MRKNSKYYNNGIINLMIPEGDEIPEGFVPGMVKRSKSEKEKSNAKRKATNLEKYGVEVPQQSKEIQEKTKQTVIDKWGVENVSQSKKVQSKREQTFIDRLGVNTPFKSKVCQEKAKQTNLERLGVENPFQSEECKEKIRQTNLERRGVEYPMQSPEVQAKSKHTLELNYGVTVPLRSPEVKLSAMESCIKKYGVPWNCMREEARIYSNDSFPNRKFAELLDSCGIEYIREFHIGTYSYDFKVGSVLIEVNPTVTHNPIWYPFGNHESRVTSEYHVTKSKIAYDDGYHCIHIFDWDDKNKIVNLLKETQKVYARKCVLKVVSEVEAFQFLNTYHLQNTCKGQEVILGLYYQEELVSLMSFGKPRYNKNYEWELLRYCSSKNIIGGAEKLFSHLLKEYQPKSIISYCDNSKFSGNVYKKLGFILKDKGKPSCHWYSEKEKRHITDNLLRQRGYDQLFNENYGKGTSNEELIIQRGYLPVYDCGQSVWVYLNN